ncbi:MAG: hypothetical protein CMJ50_00340 [Planctomycetaceae bacterium]|nr:hypothetical protein [Planctomycetaceae bacterium]
MRYWSVVIRALHTRARTRPPQHFEHEYEYEYEDEDEDGISVALFVSTGIDELLSIPTPDAACST